MDGIIIISALAAVALLCAATKKKNPQGLVEYDADADEIREGVKNGWYTCMLTIKDGQSAAILSGKMTNGEDYTGVFLISESDWQTLKNDGYQVA